MRRARKQIPCSDMRNPVLGSVGAGYVGCGRGDKDERRPMQGRDREAQGRREDRQVYVEPRRKGGVEAGPKLLRHR